MEEAFAIEIDRPDGCDGAYASKQSALCRIVLHERGEDVDFHHHNSLNNEPVLAICVLAVLDHNNTLVCWRQLFSCQTLWKEHWQHIKGEEDGELSSEAVWCCAKRVLSASGDDKLTQRLQGKEIVAQWTVVSGNGDSVALDADDSFLRMIAKAHLNKLWRKQWEFCMPRASSSPSDMFQEVVLGEMLHQLKTQQCSNQQLAQQAKDKEEAHIKWKQTAETLKDNWLQEKGRMLKNFLQLYNAKQDRIVELQQHIQLLERMGTPNKTATTERSATKLAVEGVPNDYSFGAANDVAARLSPGKPESHEENRNNRKRPARNMSKPLSPPPRAEEVSPTDNENDKGGIEGKRQSQPKQTKKARSAPENEKKNNNDSTCSGSETEEEEHVQQNCPSQTKPSRVTRFAKVSRHKKKKNKKYRGCSGSETEEEEHDSFLAHGSKKNHFDTSSDDNGSEMEEGDDSGAAKTNNKPLPQKVQLSPIISSSQSPTTTNNNNNKTNDTNNDKLENNDAIQKMTQDKLEAQALLMEDSSDDE